MPTYQPGFDYRAFQVADDDSLVGMPDVMKALGLPRGQINRLIRDGELPAHRGGQPERQRIRVPAWAIEGYRAHQDHLSAASTSHETAEPGEASPPHLTAAEALARSRRHRAHAEQIRQQAMTEALSEMERAFDLLASFVEQSASESSG